MDIADLNTLEQHVSGEIILPGDAAYDAASKVFIRKGKPAVVVRPQSSQDVAAAISYARHNQLVISVRSGGHGGPGFGTNDGGLVIDLVAMNTVDVDEQERMVRVGGGATWGQIAAALREHGLAITSGDTLTVGVAGLTLGGGIGWMVRKYGLALDQLKEVEIVTANGEVLVANEEENSELFWGIRGAGPNFGVVTHFTFVAQPIRTVFSGTVTCDPGNLRELLTAWRDVMRVAPEELNTTLVVMPPMGESPASAQILGCYAGSDEAAAQKALAPLQGLPGVTAHEFKAIAYADILDEAHSPEGVEVVVDNVLVDDFSDELIKNLVAVDQQLQNAVLMLRYIGNGAFNRVPADATAFAHRDAELMAVCGAFLPPSAPPDAKSKIRESWSMVEAFAAGSYSNFLSDATPKEVAAIYPPATLARLRTLKKQYDPQNIFNQNFNILPE